MIDWLFLAVTFAIPKAGIQMGGLPLTLNIVLTGLLIIRRPGEAFLGIQFTRWSAPLYCMFAGFAILSSLLALGSLATYQISQNLVVLASPLVIYVALRTDATKAMKIVSASLIVVVLYALMQFFIGIVAVEIPGLTVTFGQDITSKMIGYGISTAAEANKMPSTYQNGNYFGMFCALGTSLMMLWRPTESKWKHARVCSVVLGYLGIVLCGSRSIVIPFLLLGILVFIFQMRRWERIESHRNVLLLIGGMLVLFVYVAFSNSQIVAAFLDRIVSQTISDPTASGRFGQWAHIADGISKMAPLGLIRLLLLGADPLLGLGGEGFPEFVMRFGVIPAIAFYCLLFGCVCMFALRKESRVLAIGLFCSFFLLCIDQAFYYPPALMQYFLTVGIGIRYLGSAEDGLAFRGEQVNRLKDDARIALNGEGRFHSISRSDCGVME